MNNTISVYELLGLIKSGKAPKKIKYEDNIYEFTGFDYRCIITEIEKGFVEYWLIGNYNKDLRHLLNDKVEILEEDKSIIEKIEIKKYNFHNDNHSKLLKNQEQLSNKLNELIDVVNELRNEVKE